MVLPAAVVFGSIGLLVYDHTRARWSARGLARRRGARGLRRPERGLTFRENIAQAVDRRAHRPAQPRAVPRPRRAGDRPAGRRRVAAARDAHRPRPLQGGQRHPRPPRRRRAAPGRSARRLQAQPARQRHRRPPRRRRVRRAAARRRPIADAAERVAEKLARRPRASRSSLDGLAARRRGEHRHRALPRPRRRRRRRCCSAPTSRCTRPRRATPASRSTTPSSDEHSPSRLGARSASCAARSSSDELRAALPAEGRPRTGEVVGVEALVRWQHPERGLLAAGRVHPARRAAPALIRPLTALRARRALWPVPRVARARASSCRSRSTSPRATCSTPSFADAVADAARPHGVAGPTCSSSRSPRARSWPTRRAPSRSSSASHDAGRAAVDRRLRHRLLLAGLPQGLPVDELKIDRSFVDRAWRPTETTR